MILRSLRLRYTLIFSVLAALNLPFAYAGRPDPAPLPDDVVHTLLENVKSHQDPTAKRLRRYLEETSEILQKADAEETSSTNAESTHALRAELRVSIAAKLNELLSMREEVRSRFVETRQKLVDLSLPEKVETWDALKAKVEERFDRINAVLSELRDSKDFATKKKALVKAKALLHDLHGKVLAQEAVPGGVPAPTFRRKMLPVAFSKKPHSRKKPRYASDKLTPANNVYAFLGNTLLAPPATPPEAISCNYTTADLADDGHEIQLTDDIKNLAQQLG
jgi:hypothetical protein